MDKNTHVGHCVEDENTELVSGMSDASVRDAYTGRAMTTVLFTAGIFM